MARIGSKSRFLLSSSALAFSLVGYGRQAYAQVCTQTGPNAYACAGVQDYTQYGFDGTSTPGPNITVSLNPTTILSTQQSSFPFNYLFGNTIEITGDGNLALISTRDVFLYSNDGSAAFIENDGTGADGNIFVSTQYRAPDPYGGTNWGFTGYASAITAINSSDGNITMNLNNRLEGYGAGVVVEQNGSGNVVVNQATVAGQYNGSGSITATGLGAGDNALDVDQNGTGSVSITVNGDVTAAGGNAIDVYSGVNSTGTTIATGNGTISGGQNGINALNYGSGASMGITTGAGSV